MQTEMAQSRTKKAAAKPKVEGRKKSLLTEIGDEAKREAMRKALLKAVRDADWNLTAAGEALRMGKGAAAAVSVIRALKELAPDEYDQARERGHISQGNRRD